MILATGGTGLVRAAYGSGKPAYGVGPGNVPAFIERTADVRKAIGDILAGKTFDYGTICSSEQAIVAEDAGREAALEECRRQGAHFLTPEEAQKVGALVFLPGTHVPNTKIVGRPATVIAGMAGISVPAGTRVLIARLEPEQVGRDFPLSAEKLSPILAFYCVRRIWQAGIAQCKRLLEFGGLGHTCAIHSQNDAAIREFGAAVPAFRVIVNTSAVHGSIGYSTNLFPAMTLGCGAPGGNITSDNIGPLHLINVKRIAWESRRVEHRTVPAEDRMAGTAARQRRRRVSTRPPADSGGGARKRRGASREADTTERARRRSLRPRRRQKPKRRLPASGAAGRCCRARGDRGDCRRGRWPRAALSAEAELRRHRLWLASHLPRQLLRRLPRGFSAPRRVRCREWGGCNLRKKRQLPPPVLRRLWRRLRLRLPRDQRW